MKKKMPISQVNQGKTAAELLGEFGIMSWH
jgi:hypothetical protein